MVWGFLTFQQIFNLKNIAFFNYIKFRTSKKPKTQILKDQIFKNIFTYIVFFKSQKYTISGKQTVWGLTFYHRFNLLIYFKLYTSKNKNPDYK